MSFILNVSYTNFAQGSHLSPGERSIAIQMLSKSDFFSTDTDSEWPVSPHPYKEVHRFFVEDTNDEDCISDCDVERICKILHDALKDEYNVIVHCAAGISRSGAVCELGVVMGFNETTAFRSPNVVIKRKLIQEFLKTINKD